LQDAVEEDEAENYTDEDTPVEVPEPVEEPATQPVVLSLVDVLGGWAPLHDDAMVRRPNRKGFLNPRLSSMSTAEELYGASGPGDQGQLRPVMQIGPPAAAGTPHFMRTTSGGIMGPPKPPRATWSGPAVLLRPSHGQHLRADGADELSPVPSGMAGSVSLWRRLCAPDAGATCGGTGRRWARLMGKMLSRAAGAVPKDGDKLTSMGSVPHALGKPCRPCTFFRKGRGCYDGEFCKNCHFSGGHCVDPCYARAKGGRNSRVRRARRVAAEAAQRGV